MLRDTASVRYATTVGTNTVIQRRPRMALLTSAQAPGAVGPAHGAHAGDSLMPVRELLSVAAHGVVAALDGGADGEIAERQVRGLFEHFPHSCLDTVPLLLTCEITADGDPARGATATVTSTVAVTGTCPSVKFRHGVTITLDGKLRRGVLLRYLIGLGVACLAALAHASISISSFSLTPSTTRGRCSVRVPRFVPSCL
jgi:hypothetical protein